MKVLDECIFCLSSSMETSVLIDCYNHCNNYVPKNTCPAVCPEYALSDYCNCSDTAYTALAGILYGRAV